MIIRFFTLFSLVYLDGSTYQCHGAERMFSANHLFGPQMKKANEHQDRSNNLVSSDIPVRHFNSAEEIKKQPEIMDDFNETRILMDSIPRKKNFLFDLIAHISSGGDFMLLTLAEKIKRHINLTLNISPILQNVSKTYNVNLKARFRNINKQKVNNAIEREYNILYFIESANKIFASKSETLYYSILAKRNNSEHGYDKILPQENVLREFIVAQKKENLDFICKNINICKPFPAFSDYLGEIINEILKISDKKFKCIVWLIKNIAETKIRFFETIVDNEIASKIGEKLKLVSMHLSVAQKFFSGLREVLTHRYSLLKSKDGEINVRTKAVKILIDMVDKVYEVLEEDYYFYQYEKVMRDLKAWVKDDSRDVHTTLIDYCNSLVEVLEFYWVTDTRNEVKILTRVIVMESLKNNESYAYLFNNGSNYIRGTKGFFGNLKKVDDLIF